MTDLTINRHFNAQPLSIGSAYTFRFAGKSYRGFCAFDGQNTVKIRNASGSMIPHSVRQARFTNCVEV